ncbi:unnamed protein product, partial [Tenebrio molitor]
VYSFLVFTLEQKTFLIESYFRNGLKVNGSWIYSKVYKCVNMFLETGSVLRKKGSRRSTKRSAENIEEGEQRIIAEINPRN